MDVRAIKSYVYEHRLFFLFIFILFIYTVNLRVIYAADNTPNHFLPLSMLGEGNLDLNEYYSIFGKDESHFIPDNQEFIMRDGLPIPYYLTSRNGFLLSRTYIMSVFFSFPIYVAADFFVHLSANSGVIPLLAKLSASILCALSAVFLFAACRKITSERFALISLFVFAFATNVWSLASQDLWSNSVSIFFICLSLYFLVRGLSEQVFNGFLGFSLSGAIFVRPENVIFSFFVFLYLLLNHRAQLKNVFLFSIPWSILYLWYNLYYFKLISGFGLFLWIIAIEAGIGLFFLLFYLVSGFISRKYLFMISVLLVVLFFSFMMLFRFDSVSLSNFVGNTYYVLSLGVHWNYPLFLGIVALLFSPSRGLFVYSPVLLLSFVLLFDVFRRRLSLHLKKLYFYLLFFVLSFVLFYSKYDNWYGGWPFGYRFMLAIVPVFCLWLASSLKTIFAGRTLRTVFWILLALSVFIQLIGLFSFDYSWSVGIDSGGCTIDYCPERLWSVSDSQLVYYLSNPRVRLCYPDINTGVSCRQLFLLTGKSSNVSYIQNWVNR